MLATLALVAEEIGRRDFFFTGPRALMAVITAVVGAACILFHYEVMSIASARLSLLRTRRRMRIVLLIFTILLAHVVEIWTFGLAYWLLDLWPSLGRLAGTFEEGAFDFIYFSAVTYTTLGFGDIVPQGAIRILTGTEALIGLTLITWSASLAFLEMQRDWYEFRRSQHR